jgi:protein PhnA
MTDTNALLSDLRTRADGACELCSTPGAAQVFVVGPVPAEIDPAGRAVLVCDACLEATGAPAEHAAQLRGLSQSAWSEVPAVQVAAFRLLRALPGETWAADLVEQLYLDDETRAWAEAERVGPAGGEGATRPTLDSNGTRLADGDSVTLIKDLDVKGAGFTAKRGTLVKGIRLTDDPELIDARVNKIAIVLKTCFLKKAN